MIKITKMTKKLFLFIGTLCIAAQVAMAQNANDEDYVAPLDMPDATYFLPAPPDTASYIFIDDMAQWQWGKTVRDTKRGEQASRESNWQPDIMRKVMAEVLELNAINDEQTPAINRLLIKAYNTGDKCTTSAKDLYKRKRPFVQMNEPLWAEYDNDFLYTNGSYPSGHTAFGWATALAFAEMWPALQDTIMRRGYEFGENRVIAGAHWQSDVTAGYLCAAAAIARAHCNPTFDEDIRAARAEYARIKRLSMPNGFTFSEEYDVPHGERILNNPVDTASARYMTDLMQYWSNKPIRYTDRGEMARIEAEYSVKMMQKVMGEAIGMRLTDETTPAITQLLSYVLDKASLTADRLKPLRFRKRPFVQLHEPSFVAGDEEKERGKSSFPSGHTNLGWAEALVMVEVAPEHQNEILRRGYEYGHNRLIVGYHWFTDIEATRQMTSALVARLHADPTFRKLMADARAEYRSQTTGIPVVTLSKSTTGDFPAYSLDGTPATQHTRGIVIENNKKYVRR